nr:probable beta-D-xylosidase 7 [Ipomoea batatas]
MYGQETPPMYVCMKMELIPTAIGPPELLRSEIGELRDAVDGGRVQHLVALSAAQVSLEDGEPVVVLLLRRVALPELGLEQREVMVGVEQRIVLAVRHDLPDQRILRSLHPPPSIPPHSRREDLSIRLRVSRLTLVNAVPAGIPAYVQPVVGVANVEKCISLIGPISPSTSFPQVILITAASFDEDLLYHIFQSIYRSKSQLFVEGQAGTTTQMEWEREEGLYLGEKGFRREMEDSFPHGRRLVMANELIVVGERKIQNRAVIFREPAIVNWLLSRDGVLMIIGSEYFRECVQEIPEGCPITHHVVHGKSQENAVTQLCNLDAQQGSPVTVMVDSSVV